MYSHTVYTSLATITAQFHFTQTQHFYSNFVTGNNKHYSDHHVKFPICVFNCNEIFISWQILMSLQHQISQKSGQWEMSWYMQTGKKNDGQIWWSKQEFFFFFASTLKHLQTHLNQLCWWVHMSTEWATSELQNSSCIGHQTKYTSCIQR
jgi:hypothetical protein